MTAQLALEQLNRLVGTWTTEATHPAVPGLVVHGTAAIEWLQGERFLIHRAHTDQPDFPDSISIIGVMDRDRADESSSERRVAVAAGSQLSMHYFDSRGVFRVYEVSMDASAWRCWRGAPGMSQRFTGTFGNGGDLIKGLWQLSRDDVHWDDDLQITYRRRV